MTRSTIELGDSRLVVDTTVIRRSRTRAEREAWLERLPAARVTRPDWAKRGNCYGLPIGMMFPTTSAESRLAAAICQGCVSRLSCLAAARIDEAANPDPFHTYGVRGGLTATARAFAYAANRSTP